MPLPVAAAHPLTRMKQRLTGFTGFMRGTHQMLHFAWAASRRQALLAICFAIVQSLLPVVTAWLLKLLLDSVAAYLAAPAAALARSIILFTVVYVAITSLQKLLLPLDQFVQGELRRAIDILVRGDVYQHTAAQEGIAYLEDPQYHDLQTVSSQSVQQAPFVIADGLNAFIQSVSLLLSFFGLLLLLSPLLAALVLLSAIPHLLIHLQFGRDRFKLAFDLSPLQRDGFYFSHLLTGLPAAPKMRLFGLKQYLLDRWRDVSVRSNRAQSDLARKELHWKLGLELLSLLSLGVAYFFIIRGILAQQLTVGDIALYSSAVAGVQSGIVSFVRATAQVAEAHLFFSQYTRLKQLPQPIVLAEQPQPVGALQQGIQFQDVWFRYSDDAPWVLRGVTFTLPVNQCVALVGVNGAGKSTLVKLLTRLYDPTRGKILWDGVDIRAFAVADYRQRLSAVFQEFVHYQMPVWENIGLGDVQHMDDRAAVATAAAKAEIDDHISQLPDGYETRLSRWLSVGEQGTDLSGGQWQRIAIARAFMRQADVLLLDEPTAALDANAEAQVVRLFAQMKQSKTGLLISHRFSTVKLADQIVVLDEGCVIEAGCHDELLARSGVYAGLYTAQTELFQREGVGIISQERV